MEAVRWAAREAQRWNGDASRLAVAGDSAGANLSAAVAAALADDPARPRAALLIYGVFDMGRLSIEKPPPGAPQDLLRTLGPKLVELMVGSYLGAERRGLLRDPRVSPLHAAHRLPPCHLVVGGADPLVSQSEDLARALAKARIVHEHFVDDFMPHGYAQLEMLPPARLAIDRMIAFLGKHL
jgi:acetyl esterase